MYATGLAYVTIYSIAAGIIKVNDLKCTSILLIEGKLRPFSEKRRKKRPKGVMLLSEKVSCRFIEVDGEKYLCSVWYSSKDNLWYGESFETSNYPTTCHGDSKESLFQSLKKQIKIDLERRKE